MLPIINALICEQAFCDPLWQTTNSRRAQSFNPICQGAPMCTPI